MKAFFEMKDKLCKELEEMNRSRGVDYERVFYITGSIKNLEKIIQMKGGGMGMGNYSQAGSWEAEMRGDYGRRNSYDSGNSYNSYAGGGGGYSQHGNSKEDMLEYLRRKSQEAGSDGAMQQFLRRMMGELEHM